MYSFEGDFRRKPAQDFSGSKRQLNRFEVLERAREDRIKRCQERLFELSAIKIQSAYRGYATRCQLAEQFKEIFDKSQDFETRFKCSLYFDLDLPRVLKLNQDFKNVNLYRLLKMLNFNLKFIDDPKCYEFVEFFTRRGENSEKIFNYLIKRGYIEVTVEKRLQLVNRPFGYNENLDLIAMKVLCKTIFKHDVKHELISVLEKLPYHVFLKAALSMEKNYFALQWLYAFKIDIKNSKNQYFLLMSNLVEYSKNDNFLDDPESDIWFEVYNEALEELNTELIVNITKCLYVLYSKRKLPFYSYRLFRKIAIEGKFKGLWLTIKKEAGEFFSITNFIECQRVKSLLVMFCYFMKARLSYNINEISFTTQDVESFSRVLRDIAVGLITHTDDLLLEIVPLLSIIHAKDVSKPFTKPGHWLSNVVRIPNDYEINKKNKNIQEARLYYILTKLPFTVDLYQRYLLFQKQYERIYTFDSNLHTIRRDYIYEDAYYQLKDYNLTKQIRVSFVNSLGVTEAGVDGGGPYTEFITELLTTAFDPNRGFFLYTHDNRLYPNPVLLPDYENHYRFIGSMLAKAIYDGVLIDLPLADFFMANFLEEETYISGLSGLDKELYTNVMNLLNCDLEQMGLDFTISVAEYGLNATKELKPNGSNIQVNSENVYEYIYLLAEYKTKLDIRKQTEAFKEGVESLLGDSLKMFKPSELQMIISSDGSPIDIEDMKINTVYSNGFTETHPSVMSFWSIVDTFNDDLKRSLLKFITSHTRPPLMGFKGFRPLICIQRVEDVNEERLPTSSTCMNLLKLPEYKNPNILKEKLLYAIQSGAGFELS